MLASLARTRPCLGSVRRASHATRVVTRAGLKENIAKLPKVDTISIVKVKSDPVTEIPNKPGKAASVQIYNYLAKKYGALTPEAAAEGLEIYDEYVQEARDQPGSHPNIDLLFKVIDAGATYDIEVQSIGCFS